FVRYSPPLEFSTLSYTTLFRSVLGHLLVDRPFGRLEVREQLAHRRGVQVRPGEQVRARRLPLLDHGDRHLAKLLGQLRLAIEQRSEEHTSELQSLTNLVCRLLL